MLPLVLAGCFAAGCLRRVSDGLYTLQAALLDKRKPLITRASFAFASTSLLRLRDDSNKDSPSYIQFAYHVNNDFVQAFTTRAIVNPRH